MNGNGVQPEQSTVIRANAVQLRALLAALQRVPMTDLEALAVEAMFTNWFSEINDQLEQLRAMSRIEELAKRQPNGVEAGGDVLVEPNPATGNVHTPESPPDVTSGPLVESSSESLVG